MSYAAFAHDAVSVGLGALATLALFTSFPAAAASKTGQISVVHSDLDLASDAGQVTLDQRIRGAVERVCGNDAWSTSDKRAQKACRRSAMAGGRSQTQVAVAKASERKAFATSLAFAARRAGLR